MALLFYIKRRYFIKKVISIILVLVIVILLFIINKKNKVDIKIEANSSIFVITNKKCNLYDKDYKVIGNINKEVKIKLSSTKSNKKGYFELNDFKNHYIYYKDIRNTESLDKNDNYYKNYIVFNENAVTNNKTTFYDDNFKILYTVNMSYDLPIYIKEDNYYGVELNDRLVYVKKDEVDVKASDNTIESNAKDIPILLYHFFHTHNRYEKMRTVISLRADKFDDQLKYLKENNYMTLKMKDLQMYVEGKIQIKENSVVITIDDANETVFTLAYPVIEKYNINATVFAITSYDENILLKQTNLVEIHSHTHNLHITNRCSGGQGGLFKCVEYEQGVNDLKRSKQLLNDTVYLAYPFGEYTDLSINLLKETGYELALTTNYGKVKVGMNKYLIPRIYIYNEYSLNQFINIVK